MKRFRKLILSLTLVLSIVFGTTSTAFADPIMYASDSRGGTWRVSNVTITGSDSTLIEYPIQTSYVPYSQVEVFYHAGYETSSFWSEIFTLGRDSGINYAARTIGLKYGIELLPVVGTLITIGDLYLCAMNDQWKKGVQKAYFAGTGMQIDTIQQITAPGLLYNKISNWTTAPLMFYQHSLQYNNGYATGTISVGQVDIYDAPAIILN